MSVATTSTRRRFELLGGLRGARRQDLPRDLLAGVTLAALMIPLNIGYAQVAGLPPVVGLYTAILPMIAFALFSSSHHLVAGADAAIAAIIGAVLATLAAATDPVYVQLAYALALLCGLAFIAFWWFRLGVLANFLSKAVMVGFVSGLGIEVLTSQVQKILGVKVEADGYFRELAALIEAIPRANLYALGIGVGTIVIIRVLQRIAPRLPGALIALTLATVAVAQFGLDRVGVSVLGPVPSGLPTPTLPLVSLGTWLALFPGALAICGITLAEGLLLGRRYAQTYRDGIDADQELLAFGVANVAAGLSGGFAIGASASRTAALDAVGAHNQVPSLVGAGVVALLLVFFSGVLALLPNAALAGIVANAVLGLIDVGELRRLYQLRRSEFAIASVCLLSVLVLGALQAVIIAFLLSAIDLMRRVARPQTAVLTPLPGGTGFHVAQGEHQGVSLPGLIIYRFGGPLFFGNANAFKRELQNLVERTPSDHGGALTRWVVLDASAITDVDTTGADALEETLDTLHRAGVTLAVARASPPLPELLRDYGLSEKIGAERFYATDREAALAFGAATGTAVDLTNLAQVEPTADAVREPTGA